MAKVNQVRTQVDLNEPMAPITTPVDESRVVLVLTRPAALGAGTRQAGFVIGTAAPMRGGWDPETVLAADGVSHVEIENALLNQHLIESR